jgi:hypothetical protein
VIAPAAAPPDDGIKEVIVSASKVCPGESLTVDIVPAADGYSYAIDGMETESRTLQLRGEAGERVVHIDAWQTGKRESMQTRELWITLRDDCAPGPSPAAPYPTLVSEPSWQSPRVVAFTVTNAALLGASSYLWSFGDGSPTVTTMVPAINHEYGAETLSLDQAVSVFDVEVTAQTSRGSRAVQKTIALHLPYAHRRAQGVLQPPVVKAPVFERDTQTVSVSAYNPEHSELTIDGLELRFQPCDARKDPSVPVELEFSQALSPRSESVLDVPIPKPPADACGVELRAHGQASMPDAPLASYRVDFPFYVELAKPAERTKPVDDDTRARLNALASAGLLPPSGVVNDEELSLIERSRVSPLPEPEQDEPTGPQLLSATTPDPALDCAPGAAEQPPNPNWVCRATDQWLRDESYLANAHTGDIVLSASCSDIGTMLRALDTPQTYSHSGIMIQHYDAIRHSTATISRLEDNRAGPLGASGVDPTVLRFALPGVLSASVDEAYHGLTWRDTAKGKDYRIAGFSADGNYCSGDDQLMYPLVITGKLASYEKRKAIAAKALAIHAHYRFFAYSEGRISLDHRYDMPSDVGGASAATMCSSFIWTAARAAGITLEGALEASDVKLGAKTQTGILDGLYYYSAAERRAAASRLYSSIYNQVVEETGLKGRIVDAPDNWANQIANCFASDNCDLSAKDSTAWKTFTSTGRTVSPQNLLFWDDPYGQSEPLVYRAGTFRQVHQWQAPEGAGTLKVSVRDVNGAPVPYATVRIDAFAINTPLSGDVTVSPNAGRMNVMVEKRNAGIYYTGQASVVVSAGASTAVTITVKPPAATMRSVRVTGTLKVVDDEVIGKHTATLDVREDVLLNPSTRTKNISFERCAGGEARAEVKIALTLNADNSVKAVTTLKLYEGTSCNTNDLEDTKSGTLALGVGAKTSQVLAAKNSGLGGGDTARLDIVISNAQAP